MAVEHRSSTSERSSDPDEKNPKVGPPLVEVHLSDSLFIGAVLRTSLVLLAGIFNPPRLKVVRPSITVNFSELPGDTFSRALILHSSRPLQRVPCTADTGPLRDALIG